MSERPTITPDRRTSKIAAFLGALVVILATLTYWHASGMRQGPIGVPMSYEGDSLQYGYIIESFSRPGGLSDIRNAGAPFGTQNIDFPNGDFSNMALASALFGGGYGLGFNLYLLVSVALTALAGFLIALRCRLTPGWAFVVGLAFALLPFHFQRIGHLFYTNYTTAAVALWLALRISSPFLERQQPRPRRWLAMGGVALACLWCGTTGVYYALFSCIILAVGAIVQSAHARSLQPGRRAILAIVLIVATIGAQLLPTRFHDEQNGPNLSVGKRALIETEIYGLRMSQLLLPVEGHRVGALAALRHKYDTQSIPPNENATATLGLLASAGFAMALLLLLIPQVRRRFPFPQQLCAVLTLVLFIYATAGGIGSLFSLIVSPQIRALNRISPFIALFSLIVAAGTFQLIGRFLRERGANPPRIAGYAVITVVALVVMFDQVSPAFRQPIDQRIATQTRYENDREFAQRVAGLLPEGARVMQLPYIPYPEMGESLGSYAQFRNSLHAPSIHWSHGAMRARPESNWLLEISSYPATKFADTLRSTGFSALVLDKRGLAPEMAEIERVFAERNATTHFTDRDDSQIAYVAQAPVVATARAIIQDRRWHEPESDGTQRWIWSGNRPTFALSPADPGAGDCAVDFTLMTLKPMHVTIYDQDARQIGEASFEPAQPKTVTVRIPADTRSIMLENETPAEPPGNGDPRPMALRWDRLPDQLPVCRYIESKIP